jgi:hypothetical protein
MQPSNAFWDAYRRPWRKAVWIPLLAFQVCALSALMWLPQSVGPYLQEFATLLLLVIIVVEARERYVRLRRHLRVMNNEHEAHERELRALLNG